MSSRARGPDARKHGYSQVGTNLNPPYTDTLRPLSLTPGSAAGQPVSLSPDHCGPYYLTAIHDQRKPSLPTSLDNCSS